jgi:hypothetical protein
MMTIQIRSVDVVYPGGRLNVTVYIFGGLPCERWSHIPRIPLVEAGVGPHLRVRLPAWLYTMLCHKRQCTMHNTYKRARRLF